MSLNQFTKDQLAEMSLIDMAYAILETKKEAIPFKEILDEIIEKNGLTQEEVKAKIAQFYTDLNIEGRFLCLGDNRWGLRSWYPVDQAEEDTITPIKPKKKKAKKAKDEEDFDDIEDDEIDFDDYEEDDILDEDDEEDSFDDIDEVVDDFEDEDLLEDEEELEELEDEVLDDADEVEEEEFEEEEEEL